MSFRSTRWFMGMAVGGAIACCGSSAVAQITPDRTLPNNSIVTVNGSTFNITGGTQAGRNLFHSFQQFSVPTGVTASFNNAPEIQNIFSRVTGGSVSNIDGIIKASGTANLFLINPSGIVFGPNASLNIGASFVGSTASSLKFADGFEFNATAPSETPLLTVSVPIGLQFGTNPAMISNLRTPNFSNGLQPGVGGTLALVGGNIDLKGGSLTLEGGRVELGGVAGAGVVGLLFDGNNLSLSFPNDVTLADISLDNGAQVNVTSGSVNIRARSFSITDNSSLGINTREQGTVANLSILVDDLVALNNSYIFSGVESGAVGNGGDINITTGSLSLTNGAQVSASTFGKGNAGSININVRDRVSFDGTSSGDSFPSGAFSSVGVSAVGRGGNVNLKAGSLSVTNGAQVSASTLGRGGAGNLDVNVSDSVVLSGTSPDGQFPSGLRSTVEQSAVGNGGRITFYTGRMLVRDGAQVSTATLGLGNAGELTVNSRDFVELIGTSANGQFASGFTSAVEQGAVGRGGTLSFTTPGLQVQDGAAITVRNQGVGDAGNLEVTSLSISLDNRGQIRADSVAGAGGNFNLNIQNLLLMRRGSVISNTSGTAQAGGNGGNLTINIPNGFLVSVPNENSDIVTNAFNGSGGNININAFGIFNFAVRSREDIERGLATNDQTLLDPQKFPSNDIVALSQTNPNLSGLVSILPPNIDPLRTVVSNTPKLAAPSCAAFDTGGSSFTITGRGGLPPSPDEPLTNDVIWTDARIPTTTQHSSNKPSTKPHSKPKAEPIVIAPAIGWVFNKDKGEVTLISSTHNANSLGTTPATCPTQR